MEQSILDIDTALNQLGNSWKLYEKLLRGFLTHYENVDEQLMKLEAVGDYEGARLLAHSIKGLCGNLGAKALRECALTLENTYRQGLLDGTSLGKFSHELSAVIREIKKLLVERM